MKKERELDLDTKCYFIGKYFLGGSIIFLMYSLINIPQYISLVYFITLLPMGLYFISRSKKIGKELEAKIKKEKRKKNDKKKK